MNMYMKNQPLIERVSAGLYLVDVGDRAFEVKSTHREIWKTFEVTEDAVLFIQSYPSKREAVAACVAMV
jgi:hypothetical protein